MRYALVRIESGLVENLIELDEGADWTPPDGYIVVQSDTANMGDIYSDGVFTAPPPPPPPTLTPEQILEINSQSQLSLLGSVSPKALISFLLCTDLGAGTDENTVKAKEWQAYYRAVEDVDLTAASPAWPTIPA